MERGTHTPGPWQIRPPKDHEGHVHIVGTQLGDDGITIATAYPTASSPASGPRYLRREANAHLIAAAPELLDALKLASELLGHDRVSSGPLIGDYELDTAIEIIHAAIAKAEGREHPRAVLYVIGEP
jgi:hypothetical protein